MAILKFLMLMFWNYTLLKEKVQAKRKQILKNLNNGKKSGFSGVTYEMFKYTHLNNNEFIDYLCNIFNAMINSGIVPFLFNVAIMVPLVKDAKKDLDDVNNMRPISVSDAISNIFETVILSQLDKYCDDGIKQFGFKSKSSCNHAAFSLNELIRFSKRKERRNFCN